MKVPVMQLTRQSRRMVARFSTVSASVPTGSFLEKEEVVKRVLDVALSVKGFPDDAKTDSLFVADLKFDSFQRKELNDKLADEFCVVLPNEIHDHFINIDSAVKYFTSHPKAR
mmetsp:Transcript_28198/g.38794  ORF Transcript_28198/g.38794 Transcript_28198/m.38794 type:complete len:113 (+) Transcript_28198:39-377(+)|eukprot:CAMPEP_0170057178 /NCGR_PEP_ID=MMETSP0019_2-20121128/287_1 /TAXON_ID=98059 /ORGANISM="Dinobryon sp., Strain UTEXLB2267" /LENGTH=112 /DNA_ID=CAMNT_0010261831 /DNA_START=8 /DNA_END=346 /DNA_ORIENTATION=-